MLNDTGSGLTELKFNTPLDTKWVISEMLFQTNVLVSIEKIKIKLGRKNHNNIINIG